MKLHLGCGHRRLDGFVHVDGLVEMDPDLVVDVRNLTEMADHSASLIYACHVLEHIPRPEVIWTLQEWRRVLRPGGVLRVSVPDFETLAELYLNEGVSMWRIIGALMGRQNYPGNTHFLAMDYEYLAWLLGEAGFYDIRPWIPAEVLPAEYDDYSLARIEGRMISLNVEATA